MPQPKLFILTLFFVSNYSIAQLHIGLELGESNFLGYSVNIEQNIKLSRASSMSGKAGFGGLFTGWPAVPTVLFQLGVHYNHRKWGIGADGSRFSSNREHFFLDPVKQENG